MESQSFRVQSNSFRVIKAKFQSSKLKFQSSRARFHCIQHVMKLELIDSTELKSKKDYVAALDVAVKAKNNLVSTEQQGIDALTQAANNKIATLNQNKDLSESEKQTAIKRVNDAVSYTHLTLPTTERV